MNKKYVLAAGLIIGISVVTNIVLYLQNHSLIMQIEDLKASEKIYIEERSVINELIPKINTTITKEQFASAIKSIKPDERVDVLENQIGWRLFHFWFSKDGKITDVTYGS